jgi:hypothetical protein
VPTEKGQKVATPPKTVAVAFGAFDQAIGLDTRERDRAQARHREVSDCLIESASAESTFLQGSFSRKTMRRPLKDVDMVVVLPAHLWPELEQHPAKALDLFKQPLRERFRGIVRFDVHDRPAKALQVIFDDCPFTFDLVAGFEDPGGGEDVVIANRETGAWERSNSRTLRRVIAERNQATNGRFVRQVRMVKEFKALHPELEELCGLASESLTYAAVTREMPHANAVAATLRHAASAVMGPVMDPTGVDDLTVKWTTEDRLSFASVFRSGAARAEEALRLDADGSPGAAIDVWRSILGDDFPAASSQSESEALRYLTGGSVTSTGRAVSSRRGAQPLRPARAWRRS